MSSRVLLGVSLVTGLFSCNWSAIEQGIGSARRDVEGIPDEPVEDAGMSVDGGVEPGVDGGTDAGLDAGTPSPPGYYEWTNRSSSVAGSFQYFIIYIPANTPALTVASWGGSGTGSSWANLYLRYGSKPTTRYFDAASRSMESNEEFIVIQNPKPGNWWIGLHANTGYTGIAVVASY